MLVFLLGMACTAGAAEFWDITLVDRKEGVGGYSSLAILPSGQPAISYRYGWSYEGLKYAELLGHHCNRTAIVLAKDCF